MEYIKKQKLIIKKKQAEIDALAVAKQTSGAGGEVAGAAGGAVLFERLKPLFGDARRLRSAFLELADAGSPLSPWASCKESLRGQVLAYAASERKGLAKLKALLARTHSSQPEENIEDSKLLKKEQQMSKEELTQLKAREESELKDLQEVQRATSLESAFQYDTDRKIAEAVAAFIANRPEVNPETATPQEEENEARRRWRRCEYKWRFYFGSCRCTFRSYVTPGYTIRRPCA